MIIVAVREDLGVVPRFPPPLPWRVERRTQVAAVLVASTLGLGVAMSAAPVLRVVTSVDVAVLGVLARLRVDAVTRVAEAVTAIGSDAVLRTAAWVILLVLVVTRRWRHLVVYLVVTLTVAVLVAEVTLALGRPRPAGVVILGGWEGYSFPSRPVAGAALVLVAGLCTVVPAGRLRTRGAWAAALLVAALGGARLYLAVDHPSDVLAALALGGLLPLAAFRLLTPDEVFPLFIIEGLPAATYFRWVERAASGRCQVVAADTHPALGVADVPVPAETEGGPLSVRCRVSLQVGVETLRRGERTGTVAPDVLDAVRRRMEEIAAGSFTEEPEPDPEWEDWHAEALLPARAALLPDAVNEPAPRRRFGGRGGSLIRNRVESSGFERHGQTPRSVKDPLCLGTPKNTQCQGHAPRNPLRLSRRRPRRSLGP